MDKNTLVGFILIGAVIVGFGIYNRPSQEERARAQHYQDSIQQVIKQQQEVQEKQAAAAIEAARPDSTSLFFQAAQGTEQFTVLENELVQLTFSNKGGRVSKALLKEYKDQKKQPLVLFDGEDASMNFGFEGKNENILSQQMYFEATNVTDSTVTMRLNAANGGHLDFNYRLLPNSYMVDLTVQASGMQNFFSPSTKSMNIEWKQRARQMEKGYNFEQRYTSLTYKPVDDSFDYLSETKDEKETIRDVLLDVTPAWMTDPMYLICTAFAMFFVILFGKYVIRLNNTFFIFDTIGLALFTVVGFSKAYALGYPFWIAIIMGSITGAAGGVLRDIFINEIPLIFRKEIYAMACVIGGLVYWICLMLDMESVLAQIIGGVTVFVARILAVKYKITLPILKGDPEP
jgi:uncharacterized membrane protein YeiH